MAISYSIKESYFFTLFFAFRMSHLYKDYQPSKQYKYVVKRISQNKELQAIEQKRRKLFYEYIMGQNKVTFFILRTVFNFNNLFKKRANKLKQKISTASQFPEVCIS